MHIKTYTRFNQLSDDPDFTRFENFVNEHPQGSYFQGADFFRLTEGLPEFSSLLLVATDEAGVILGSLLGHFQVFGNGLKSWMSRRLVVTGGPLVGPCTGDDPEAVVEFLLENLEEQARGKAIYIEFRNQFDTESIRSAFEKRGFEYRPHLNFLLKTDTEETVKKRMSSSRRRQIRQSLATGAVITEPESTVEVETWYGLLEKLYAEKIKKPLVSLPLFMKFYETGAGKIFLVKYKGRIVGGIVCPIFNQKIIYEWYICGLDGEVKNLYPSVLATWAPIEYGLKNGLCHFDFLGAGKPGVDYGVRDFKARFGGEEVCFGRYEMVLNKPLYKTGKLALNLYQKLSL